MSSFTKLSSHHRLCCHRTFTPHSSSVLDTKKSAGVFTQSTRTAFYDHWIKFDRWQDRVGRLNKETRQQRLLKRWIPQPSNSPFRPAYITPERLELDLPQKPLDERVREEQACISFDASHRIYMLRYLDLSSEHMARKQRYDRLIELQYDQRLIPERQLTLGPDLAAAHFIVNRSGAIKFFGDEQWHKINKKGDYVLPVRRIDGLFLEAIDASKTEIMFEGFDHLTPLKKLRFLSLVDCNYMTDWCLARMNQFEKSLEYLDLSHCKRISAKGLSALACLKSLKYLRLEGLDHVKNLGQVVLMLEDTLPGLTVIGVDFEKTHLEVEKRAKLLAHPNVVQDARGNIYLEDKLGELYYLDGQVNERAVVDEDELPMIHSTIRPDPPALPLEELNLLNELSDGRLKHLLAGNPSGLERQVETNRVLDLDKKWRSKKKLPLHPFLDSGALLESENPPNTLQFDDETAQKLLLNSAKPG